MSELRLDGLDELNEPDELDGAGGLDGVGLEGALGARASRGPASSPRVKALRGPKDEPAAEASAGSGAGPASGGKLAPPPTATLDPAPDPTAELDPAPPESAAPTPKVGGESRAAATSKPALRRGAVDPVKALMHRHRELCERAVDPLEIAAGLEAHGVTDRTAARFRHRDVFSLAEEMYARVPRDEETPPERDPVPGAAGAGWGWAVLALLPGALCAAAVAGVRLVEGQPRVVAAVAAIGALAVTLGLRVALGRGPLRAPSGTRSRTRAWTCWLIAYALLGDGLLAAGLDGGPHGRWPLAAAPVLGLALACAPAIWCAHLLSVRARRKLAASRGLAEFADSVRPLLLGVFVLYMCALAALLALCGALLDEPAAYAGAGALGALLLFARLLTAHGSAHAPAVVLCTASLTEAFALVTVFASRLPGYSFLAVPVETVVAAWGPGAVPALVCGTAALVLLVHATRTLTRASAHALSSEDT